MDEVKTCREQPLADFGIGWSWHGSIIDDRSVIYDGLSARPCGHQGCFTYTFAEFSSRWQT
jgi:hypothetical protein